MTLALRVAARFQKKKKLETGTVVYEYSERQVADRNRRKARRLEKLRNSIGQLRTQVKKDLSAGDQGKRLTALAVGLMDETYERVGNDESAGDGHFGVTGWTKKHISFGSGKATISYVGKSGVRQKKTVSNGSLVKALRKAYNECKDGCVFKHQDAAVGAEQVNDYLTEFDITAKDIRGLHANEVMKSKLKAARGGKLSTDPKKRKKQLADEFKKALEETASAVGHEPSTLRSQYLVPGLEDKYVADGSVMTDFTKTGEHTPNPKVLEAAVRDDRDYCICTPKDGRLYVEVPTGDHLANLLLTQRFRDAHFRTQDGYVPYDGGGIAFKLRPLMLKGVTPIWYPKKGADKARAVAQLLEDGVYPNEREAYRRAFQKGYASECEWVGPKGLKFDASMVEFAWYNPSKPPSEVSLQAIQEALPRLDLRDKEPSTGTSQCKTARSTVPTGQETFMDGQIFYMPLGKDRFVHFTTTKRAEQILADGKLLMNPPYKKMGIHAVAAVSTIWGWYSPKVQTTHVKAEPGEDVVAIVFKTSTKPEYGYVEEVIWHRDVQLQNPKLVSFPRGASMLKRTPERLPNDADQVTYDKGKTAKTVSIDQPWVDKMRKDFLVLMRNIPRIKDYKTAHQVAGAIRLWRERFSELFFNQFMNKSLKYDRNIPEDVRKYLDHKLRKVAWDFYIDFSLPLDLPSDYYSEEARFIQYERESKRWVNRTKKKAQVFWRELREAIDYYEDAEHKIRYRREEEPEKLEAELPDTDRLVIEGFQVEMQGFQPDDRGELEIIKPALRHYRQRAKQVLPWLIQHQLPLVIDFQANLDKGGEYIHGQHIILYATSAINKPPASVAKTLAHEMGHHLFKHLGRNAETYWNTAIRQDYGPIDLRALLAKWTDESMWAYEFAEFLEKTDPVLSIQIDVAWQGWGGRMKLEKREDFQKLLDSGERSLAVPKTPITGYAGKNPEEAFCEAVGLLVAYGPRAVHEKIRHWLDVILPGQVKTAETLVERAEALAASL